MNMEKKRGIPSEILNELNIKVEDNSKDNVRVTAVVENHQVKLPVPSRIRREVDFKKGQKLNAVYDPEKRTITYFI